MSTNTSMSTGMGPDPGSRTPAGSARRPDAPFRITVPYLVAVSFIYLVTSISWLYLGAVTDRRTVDKDERLRAEVGQLWGGSHEQATPAVTLQAATVTAPSPRGGDSGSPAAPTGLPLPADCIREATLEPRATRARADLELEHRRKGLLWYSTYSVRFEGTYTLTNPSSCRRAALVQVPLPARGAIYDAFTIKLDGRELPLELGEQGDATRRAVSSWGNQAVSVVNLEPGETHRLLVSYRSRGMDRWSYVFGSRTARAQDFQLVVHTNFDEIDFPPSALSPTHKRREDGGWQLTWSFSNLLADTGIAVVMPQRINPGPLSAEISRFAPVSLFFFFFVLLLVSLMRQVRLHPVHFGLLAAAFFSFHLLLAYLVDLLPLWAALSISSFTSVGLVVSYLRLAVGSRFALLWAGGAQLLYLVLFSLAFLLQGYTGLTITIFSVLTLFVVMQLTGRVDWSARFGRGVSLPPFPPGGPPLHGPQPFSAAAGAVGAMGPEAQVFRRLD